VVVVRSAAGVDQDTSDWLARSTLSARLTDGWLAIAPSWRIAQLPSLLAGLISVVLACAAARRRIPTLPEWPVAWLLASLPGVIAAFRPFAWDPWIVLGAAIGLFLIAPSSRTLIAVTSVFVALSALWFEAWGAVLLTAVWCGIIATAARPIARWAAWTLAAVSVIALGVMLQRAPTRAPIDAAIGALRADQPRLRSVIAGPGIADGLLQLIWREQGGSSEPAVAASEPIGEISRALSRPSSTARRQLERRFGERVLAHYGVVERAGELVRWAVHQPVKLPADPGARPNIAIISIDTLRADRLELYGYERATAPQLAAWAADAVVYERAYATASSTVPSFASIMTGRLPLGHGARGNAEFMLPGNWTLARILDRIGYDTAAFISSSVLVSNGRGLDDGFARYDETLDYEEPQRPGNPLRLSKTLAPAVTSWLDQRAGSQTPWFLWVHCIDPHGPYNPLPEFAGTFRSEQARIVERQKIPEYQWKGTEQYRVYHDAYDDEVRQFDTLLAPIWQRLDAIMELRPTIVIFVADHGEAFGEHGWYFRHNVSLYREEIHVPLIWKESGARRGERIATPVSTLDLVPTLLARLGVQTDLPLDGVTLEQRVASSSIVPAGYRPGFMTVIDSTHKLIIDRRDPNLRYEATFDLQQDPGEAHPRSESPPALRAEIERLLARDPLSESGSVSLEQGHWDERSDEELENLKSLGYVGPGE
jgi:arylsulfatase